MILQQISVFMENRAGQLSEILSVLAEQKIDLRALNIAETTDYGVLRLIVSEPERAADVIREQGALVNVNPVVAATVPDCPGGLSKLLSLLTEENVDISYMYSVFGQKEGLAHMILRVDDPEAVEAVLAAHGNKTDHIGL